MKIRLIHLRVRLIEGRLLECCRVGLLFRHSPLPGANDEKVVLNDVVTQGVALGYHLAPLQGFGMGGGNL